MDALTALIMLFIIGAVAVALVVVLAIVFAVLVVITYLVAVMFGAVAAMLKTKIRYIVAAFIAFAIIVLFISYTITSGILGF